MNKKILLGLLLCLASFEVKPCLADNTQISNSELRLRKIGAGLCGFSSGIIGYYGLGLIAKGAHRFVKEGVPKYFWTVAKRALLEKKTLKFLQKGFVCYELGGCVLIYFGDKCIRKRFKDGSSYVFGKPLGVLQLSTLVGAGLGLYAAYTS